MSWSRAAWGCVALLISVTAHADQTVRIHDLAYGEALFHFYKQDYFMSGVRLMVAEEQNLLSENRKDGELLLGGLQLSYGMHQAATETLNRVLSDDVSQRTQNQAWYYLARLAYRRGYWERAQQALSRITDDQSPESAAQTALLKSLIAMETDQPAQAVEVLSRGYEESPLTPYLHYNLGVAQLRNRQRDSALKLLDRLGREETDSPEQSAVKDRANLAAAFSELQAGNAESAQRFFQRVRLQESDAKLALLGSGWAAAENSNYDLALKMWGELIDRAPRDASVLEALFAVPFAYVQMNDPARAAHHYEKAISIYLQEREKLSAVVDKVRGGDYFTQIARESRGYSLPVVPALQQLELPELVSSHAFREGWKNYRDLTQLQQNLVRWDRSLGAFDTMLVTRKARFDTVVPTIENRLLELDVEGKRKRAQRLKARLQSIRQSGDVWQLATPDQRQLLSEIESIKNRLKLVVDPEERLELTTRIRRVEGVLYWQVHSDYPERLWESTKRVKSLDTELETMELRLATLRGARSFANSRLGDLGSRVATNRRRVSTLLPRIDAALARQTKYLSQLTLQTLTERRAYLESYLLQARYALAQLYDKAQSEAQPQ